MSQITLNIKKPNQSYMVGSDAKNALSTNTFDWTELAGLSWIFQKDDQELEVSRPLCLAEERRC